MDVFKINCELVTFTCMNNLQSGMHAKYLSVRLLTMPSDKNEPIRITGSRMDLPQQ